MIKDIIFVESFLFNHSKNCQMNTKSNDYKNAVKLGESLVGKYAQSRLLTELTATGKQVLSAPQKITGFEVVESFKEPTVMAVIGGEVIFEDLLINIH